MRPGALHRVLGKSGEPRTVKGLALGRVHEVPGPLALEPLAHLRIGQVRRHVPLHPRGADYAVHREALAPRRLARVFPVGGGRVPAVDPLVRAEPGAEVRRAVRIAEHPEERILLGHERTLRRVVHDGVG